MKSIFKILGCSIFLAYCGIYNDVIAKEALTMMPKITTEQDLRCLFPGSGEETLQRIDAALEQTRNDLNNIIARASEQRTYENTVQAFDTMSNNLGTVTTAIHVLQYVSPDDDIRARAQEAILKAQNFSIDEISHNKALYTALKEYAEHRASLENLNPEEKKYLKETIEGFEKSGLGLPDEKLSALKALKKELAELSLAFSTNINTDQSVIHVTYEELAGLDEIFIRSLKQDHEGRYILGVDYPTVHAVMDNCSVSATREKLWCVFNGRAYPKNTELLEKIIALRDRLAKMLGFASYAHLEIDDEMAKTPERVRAFLEDLYKKTADKVDVELTLLKNNLPAGVQLTAENQFKPWDVGYTKNQYKKNVLSFDAEKLREFFPMQKTIDAILEIYSQFLGVTFSKKILDGLWHEDVVYVVAHDKQGNLLGHLLLDLHPRSNKFSHACKIGVVSAVRTKEGEYFPPVIVILANFAKPNAEQPSLLHYSDVKTFFHEFGHAVHSLFGATQMSGFSGTHVTRDFVEVPSQMLEEWMYDPTVLKRVSHHYLNGQSLDEATMKQLQDLKTFDSGHAWQRQIGFSLLALDYFASGEKKDVDAIKRTIQKQLFGAHVASDSRDHNEASFGHLMGYGARYYSYVWSKVFAIDMFYHIKTLGLLNPVAGQHYIDTVISKGGSVDPDILIADFLGRQPTMDAFLKDLGL